MLPHRQWNTRHQLGHQLVSYRWVLANRTAAYKAVYSFLRLQDCQVITLHLHTWDTSTTCSSALILLHRPVGVQTLTMQSPSFICSHGWLQNDILPRLVAWQYLLLWSGKIVAKRTNQEYATTRVYSKLALPTTFLVIYVLFNSLAFLR